MVKMWNPDGVFIDMDSIDMEPQWGSWAHHGANRLLIWNPVGVHGHHDTIRGN